MLLLVEKNFAPEFYIEAERILAEGAWAETQSGTSVNLRSWERIQHAAIKWSGGSLDKLRCAVDLAHKDWRDLLVFADFGESVEADKEWAENILQDIPITRLMKFRFMVRGVCSRPVCFVGEANFSMATSYIHGYLDGLREATGEVPEVIHLRDFGDWLADKFKEAKNQVWHWTIEKRCSDDEAAFEQLFLLHEEFWRARQKP